MSDIKHSIVVASGVLFDPFVVDLEKISINDIAVGLSNTPRFRGQTIDFYSVAQHCVNVSNLVLHATSNPYAAFVGLLHDAAEAYLGDVPTPFKAHQAFAGFRVIEDNLLRAIFLKLGAAWPVPDIVHLADDVLLHCEARVLLTNSSWAREEAPPECVDLLPWDSLDARYAFLNTYFRLKAAVVDAHVRAAKEVTHQ